MGKIGDLWVRLGLKKDDYTKGLKEAAREGESFGKGVAALGSKAKIAFAAVAAAVTGVIAAVKDLAKQNQVLGDAWNRMSAGMAASWDTFKTAVASMDFSHLLSNMREAYRLAKELYNAADAMGEITNAYNISYGEQAAEIARLKVELADATRSDEERLEAGRKLLEIYTKLEGAPTRGLNDIANKTIDVVAGRLGYHLEGANQASLDAMRQEVKDFFVWLGTEQGKVYNEAAQKVAGTLLGKDSKVGQNFMRNAANNGVERFAELAINYNKSIGKQADQMAQAIRAAGEQQAKFDTETKRIQGTMNSIRNGMESSPATPGAVGTPERVDTLQQELQLLRQELAEEQAIAAADAEFARQADEAYEAMRKSMGYDDQVQIFDNDMLLALERGLNAAREFGDELNKVQEKSEDLARSITENLVSALENGLVGAFDALAEVMGGVTEGGMEQVARALIEPLADMAIKAGTLIMMSGTAIEALKESLIGFFGGNAVLAGAALVAVGVAAKAGLAAIGNKGGGSVSSFSSNTTPVSAPSNVQTAELVVHVEGTVKGSDIILSGNNTLKSWGR